MNERFFRRFGWVINLLIGAVGIIIYFYSANLEDQDLKSFSLNLASELIGVALIFFLVNQFLEYDPQRRLSEIMAKMDNLLNKTSDKISEVRIFPTRKATLDTAIALMEKKEWEVLRIYAPVGVWEINDLKKEWLRDVVRLTAGYRVRELRGVFGLPPLKKYGECRPLDEVATDIAALFAALEIFNNLNNVELHFSPPDESSVGFGAYIFEDVSKTSGEVAFGLATLPSEEAVNIRFGIINNNEMFYHARDWFDDKIFYKSTGHFILHDKVRTFKQRWPNIIKGWYGDVYFGRSEEILAGEDHSSNNSGI